MTQPSISSWQLAARLAGRELRGGIKGFYIFIACLWLGVASIAAVQSLSDGMLTSLRADSRALLGGDLTLRRLYQPADTAQRQRLQENFTLSEVIEMRAMARRADDAKAAMVELKAVDALYPLYGAVTAIDAAGKTAPALRAHTEQKTPGALVEADLLTRLDLRIGDQVKVGDASFVIAGVITHEPDRMSGARYTLAPRLLISSADFAATGLSAAGNQVTYSYRLLTPTVTQRADMTALEAQLEKELGPGWQARSFYNAAPGITRAIDQLTLFLTLIGLATLLIGGVGMSNAVRGWLDGKMASLATLKSLGAGRRLVMRVFLLQILAAATLAIALGCLTGSLMSAAARAPLADLLSLNASTGLISLRAAALAAGFGYLTVFAFVLWPLGRALEVSPRDLFRSVITPAVTRPRLDIMLATLLAATALAGLAVLTASDRWLAGWFIVATLAAFALFSIYALAVRWALLRRRPYKHMTLRLAAANLTRPGNMTRTIVLSLGLGLTVLTAIAAVESNFSRLLRDDLALDAPSFFFLDVEPQQAERFGDILRATPGVDHIKLTPAYRGRIIAVNGVDAERALVDQREEWVIRSDRGFTVARDMPAHSRLIAGAWWPQNFSSAAAGGAPQVSIASDVARAFAIGVGDQLTVNIMGVNMTATVANVRDINWASFSMNFAVTFAPGALDAAPTNLLATATVPPAQEDALQTRLARDMPNITSVRVREALALASTLISGVLTAVRIGAGVTLIAGVLVLAGALAAARQRQAYDSIVLKILGATRARLMLVFAAEYAALGMITAVIASVLGSLGAYGIIVGIMDLPWHFSIAAVAITAVVALALTLATGVALTLRVLALKPATALRNV